MRGNSNPPVYSQVAYDIATKIAKGTLKEKTKFSGRSLMSTEYRVSQETIRRALKQLADLGIVEIQASGAVVISQNKATGYIEKFQSSRDLLFLKKELRKLLAERDQLNQKILQHIELITDLNERFTSSDPLKNYEFEVLPNSQLIGKTIGESEFRKLTKATIVAIRSQDQINLSPDPNTIFNPYDILVVAGNPTIIERVKELINN
jgi:K+/H+ antiporter YhaU regulatory subunit KhtT